MQVSDGVSVQMMPMPAGFVQLLLVEVPGAVVLALAVLYWVKAAGQQGSKQQNAAMTATWQQMHAHYMLRRVPA